jgi:hypothetical protein
MTDHKHLLRIVSDTLGDEVVWNVVVSKFELLAIDKGNAKQLANAIAKLIDKHTISNADSDRLRKDWLPNGRPISRFSRNSPNQQQVMLISVRPGSVGLTPLNCLPIGIRRSGGFAGNACPCLRRPNLR